MPAVNEYKDFSVLEYTDYRAFLKAWYLNEKRRNPAFSYRVFSQLAGFASPNFLKLVSDGKRNLSEPGIRKFSRGLGLSKFEFEYFHHLVLFNQSEAVEERIQYGAVLHRLRSKVQLGSEDDDAYRYYSRWYYVVLRELVALDDFRASPEWIARALGSEISLAQAEEALESLVAMGLLRRDQDGRFHQTQKQVSTESEVISSAVARFTIYMIERALKSIDAVSPDRREVSSVTITLSEEGLRTAKQKIQELKRELLELEARDRHRHDVVQVNFQMFPLTESAQGRKAKQ